MRRLPGQCHLLQVHEREGRAELHQERTTFRTVLLWLLSTARRSAEHGRCLGGLGSTAGACSLRSVDVCGFVQSLDKLHAGSYKETQRPIDM